MLLSNTAVLVATVSSFGFTHATKPLSHFGQRQIDTRQNTEPCAQVAKFQANDVTKIPAELAQNCLQSVPVDIPGGTQLLEDFKLYLEWQTTLEYLKRPPEGYHEPPVDLMAGLDTIKEKLNSAEGYAGEYEFQLAIRRLINSAYDNHLVVSADIFGLFQFARQTVLVSVSEDGLKLPKVYSLIDLVIAQRDGTYHPAEVTHINGEDVQRYLEDLARKIVLMDIDARFNDLFPNQAKLSIDPEAIGQFAASGFYEGLYTNVTFANGTVQSFENQAIISSQYDWTGVDSGAAFFKKFCTKDVDAPTSVNKRDLMLGQDRQGAGPISTETSTETTPRPTQRGYPDAVTISNSSMLGGYFLDNSDVAVLSIPSFFPPDGTELSTLLEWQNTLSTFLDSCRQTGKQKLIIDIRGNGGGVFPLGYETFKQLFPTIEPYGATRFRSHPDFQVIEHGMSLLLEDPVFRASENFSSFLEAAAPFDYQIQLTDNGKPFKSWQEFAGPYEHHGDNFTAIVRHNFSNPQSYLTPTFQITGYNTLSNTAPQPFKSDSIVMLHDGFCTSTCNVFAELMKTQGRARSVVVGGRPQTGPMQAIGGSKGVNIFDFGTIQSTARGVFDLLAAFQPAAYAEVNGTRVAQLAYGASKPLQRFTGNINSRDNIRKDDPEDVPLQFVYEAADCRFFYTADMVLEVQRVWERTVEVAWQGGACVEGSTGHPSSLSGAQGGAEGNNGTNGTGWHAPTPTVGSDGPRYTGAAGRLGAGSGIIGVAVMVFVGFVAL